MAKKSLNGQPDGLENGKIGHVSGMYKDYFLDYASYVILERAVPLLNDGLKPVQRRILHSLKEKHDGRYHKVANLIGHTMQYHPHGDQAIGDALVKMGQKDLLIDCQGNWGDTRTGDGAAAPRYIEARLTKFALDVVYNPAITDWQASYDGRNKEPVSLPVKFPLVLNLGADGIAVGLSTKIMPHNFCELCKASIRILQGKGFTLIPDFPNGGMVDPSNYAKGKRGGKIRVRAHIEVADKNTLLIKDVPYGTTTGGLIDSIIKANDKGKLKIKKVVDNTARDVEVQIDLPNGVSPDVTIDALYAFTGCETSISPNTCVIIGQKPHFLTVDELLHLSTENTKQLLKEELEVRLAVLKEKRLFSSLEKIFIENRIYRDIEECETWEDVIKTIDKGIKPYKKLFYRKITEDDIVRLTEIKIKRISKFDTFKADELLRKLEEDITDVEFKLAHLNEYAIQHFEDLLTKYGKNFPRKTEVMTFDTIKVKQVAIANEKLYVNRKDGFVGYGMKKDEYVCECSDMDDVIAFCKSGAFKVIKVQDKAFIGKDIIHVDVWKKGDERMVYHAVYRDPDSGKNYIKRFSVNAITRDREYNITKGTKGSKLLYFTANPNSESEVVEVRLSQGCRAKKKIFDFDFAELAIKGRSSQGNVLTKYPVSTVKQLSVGSSTLGGRKIWYDKTVGRINTDERGVLVGEFDTEDQILVIYSDGTYVVTDFELTNRYDGPKVQLICKLEVETIVTAVHYDAMRKDYFVKRFFIETTTQDERYTFINEAGGSKLITVSVDESPTITFTETKGKAKQKEDVELDLSGFIDIKGWKSLGNKLSRHTVSKIKEVKVEKKIPKKVDVGSTVSWDVNSDDESQKKLF